MGEKIQVEIMYCDECNERLGYSTYHEGDDQGAGYTNMFCSNDCAVKYETPRGYEVETHPY
jgi:hypothetical protein